MLRYRARLGSGVRQEEVEGPLGGAADTREEVGEWLEEEEEEGDRQHVAEDREEGSLGGRHAHPESHWDGATQLKHGQHRNKYYDGLVGPAGGAQGRCDFPAQAGGCHRGGGGGGGLGQGREGESEEGKEGDERK